MSINVIGAPEQVAPNGLRQYTASYLQADFLLNPFSGEGLRHLLFTTPSEAYVLPSAFALVSRTPPQFTAAVNPDRTVTLTGSSLSAATRVWFDGVPVAVRTTDEGNLVVTPPPAPGGHRAFLTALNPDGQSSYFLMGNASPTYTYDQADAPQITAQPAILPAGAESAVEITGTGTTFSDAALPRIGFGTSDIQVRKLMVAGPNRLLAQVSVAPTAVQAMETMTATNGLQLISQPYGFQVGPQNSRQMFIVLSAAGALYAYPGAVLTLPVGNATAGVTAANVQVTVGDRAAAVLAVNGNLLTFQVPALPLGPAMLKATWAGDTVLPAAILVEAPPPVILGAATSDGTAIDAQHPVRPGDTITLTVANLSDAVLADYSRLGISIGGVSHSAVTIAPNPNQASTYLMTVVLASQLPPATQTAPIVLTQDGHASQAFALTVITQ